MYPLAETDTVQHPPGNSQNRSSCKSNSTHGHPKATTTVSGSRTPGAPCPPVSFTLIPALKKIVFSLEDVAYFFKNNTSNGVFSVCFHVYVSGSLKEAVKVWNFLSLLCLPIACLPGRGIFSRLICLFLPSGLRSSSTAGGVSASPHLRVSLNPVLPFQCPLLTCSGLPRGLAPPVCPRLLTLTASLLTPVDVLGASSQLGVQKGATGH